MYRAARNAGGEQDLNGTSALPLNQWSHLAVTIATACAQWSGEHVSRYDGSFRARDSAPILVVGTTGDPDPPYQDAVPLSRELDSGRLLTFEAEGRTAFGRSACATDALTSHLVDLKVPARGTTCTDETRPPSSTPTVAPPGITLGELRYGVGDTLDRIGTLR
jgi:hypothetical protein